MTSTNYHDALLDTVATKAAEAAAAGDWSVAASLVPVNLTDAELDAVAAAIAKATTFSKLVLEFAATKSPLPSVAKLMLKIIALQPADASDMTVEARIPRFLHNYKRGGNFMLNRRFTVDLALTLYDLGEEVPLYDDYPELLLAGGLVGPGPKDQYTGLLLMVLHSREPVGTDVYDILKDHVDWVSERINLALDEEIVAKNADLMAKNFAQGGDGAAELVSGLLSRPATTKFALEIVLRVPKFAKLIASAQVPTLLDWMQTHLEASVAAQAAQHNAADKKEKGGGDHHHDHRDEGLTLQLAGAFDEVSQRLEVPTELLEQLRNVQFLCLRAFPRIINWGQGHDDVLLASERLSPVFSEDVETEMRMCFQEMYEQQYEIREVITMLERLKHSSAPRDQDLFACMIHSLFDEYRFFPDYPVSALATTAVLFGSLVHFRLIDGIPLSIALRYILESLRQPVESNMFRFGLQALFEFRQRLPEFAQYCGVLMAIPGLASQQQFFNQIKAIVEPDTGTDFHSISAVVPGVDEFAAVVEPAEDLKNKILFAVNNITAKTVTTKAQTLQPLLEPKQMHRWFAQYLVGRAVGEPNYHSLYLSLLDELHIDLLGLSCLQVLYQRVHGIIVGADATSSDRRTQLKNLGSFLGELTLGRNKPIWRTNLNLRLLLAESSRHDKLPATLPFVCKILAGAAKSRVFGTQTPWMQAQLAVLSELYHHGGLKLTLKFEIEVLGNALGVTVADIPPADYVRNDAAQQADSSQADELDFDIERLSLVDPVPASGGAPTPSMPAIPIIGGLGATQAQPIQAPPLATQVVGTTDFVTHPTLRPLLELAVSKTVQEVLLPVVDRSASIASFTAKELVLKDFVAEPDEHKLQTASHTVSSVLATAMALITAKDPFVDALAVNLRALLAAHGIAEPSLLEQVPLAAQENMEAIVPLVESVAREKAVAEVDDALANAYAVRQRAAAGGPPLPSPPTLPVALPESLMPLPGGLTPQQFGIYEHFSTAATQPAPAAAVVAGAVSGDALLAQFQSAFETLNKQTAANPDRRLADLSGDDPIVVVLAHMLSATRASLAKGDDGILRASQLVIQHLFGDRDHKANGGPLLTETLCYLLAQLCQLSPATAREVMLWLLYADDDRKFSVPVVSTLLKTRLVAPADLDATIAKDVLREKPEAIVFAAQLVLDSVLGPEPFCLRTDFAATVGALALSTNPAASVATQALRESCAKDLQGSETEAMGHVFAEWARLNQSPTASPKLLRAFVVELLSTVKPQQLLKLVRTALEVSVESYAQVQSTAGLDALAQLIAMIVPAASHPEELLRNLLTVATMVLAREHEAEREEFRGRAYFRFLSTFAGLVPEHFAPVLGQTLETLQPLAFPAFTASWIALMSHRFIMGRLLRNQKEGWPVFVRLFEALLRVLQLPESEQVNLLTVRAIERILLVTLHDCPEILILHHTALVAALPSSYTQLRNIVLCAFPADAEGLPDPLTTSLDSAVTDRWLDESLSGADKTLTQMALKKPVDAALRSPTAQAVLDVAHALALETPRRVQTDDVAYSLVAMGALATYLARQPSADDETRGPSTLVVRLLSSLPAAGRYHLLSAVADQLRYPSLPTAWASSVLLNVFLPADERVFGDATADIRQVATRVLLERVVCHRPHPWGLMATVATLLRTPTYHFWELPFLKTTPELEHMFSALYNRIISPVA